LGQKFFTIFTGKLEASRLIKRQEGLLREEMLKHTVLRMLKMKL
jgi:hypothetical protein